MSTSLRCVVVLLVLIPGCRRSSEHPIRRESTAMGSFVSITVYGGNLSHEEVNAAIDSAFSEIRRVEEMATDYNDTSEVGQVNLRAGVDSVLVSPELISLIETGLAFAGKSDGAFDIAVGPIVREWDFLAEHPRVPSDTTIARLLPLIDHRRVIVASEKVFLAQRGMSLDLGGIAKGYAVDRAVATLRRRNCSRFIVDVGGNLGVSWEGTRMFDSTAATISIRHPRREGEFFGEFRVGTAGVSTSGDYQRCFIRDGVRYHHIIDPRTGRPVANGVVSVTIVAADATTADALSTLIFVLGRDNGFRFLQSNPGVEGLIVFQQDDTLSFIASPGFEQRFSRSETP